ncbi:response regulator [Coleofasciculus sp. FACHB-64]|uniref:ATP-binding protein n=1 Tax=Cyanophyceae TaxID=3028117 RepID=UPI0016898383|nr:response regulator [Coleofasciculus sp. FACHB-501]MBD2046026.1 response regulator [Coleofasciculus sp. FACHB-64]MBD2087581.1 response regulator [Coleofasciculus sp. FACHB-542]
MTPEQFLEFARPLPEPMLLIAGNGQLLAANPPFSKMLGLPRQLLQEKMLFEMVVDPADKVKQYLRACSSSREMVIGSLTFNANNGETCLCRCEGAVIRPRSPESPALILLRLKNKESASSRFTLLNKKIDELAKEIRQRQRAEEERAKLLVQEQKARVEAEKLNRLKDEFLSTVSHELRTPLNAILGWSNILRTSKVDAAKMHRALETIERNARSQAQLVDDLLDISRIITGKIRLNVQTVDLLPAIQAAIDTVRPAADAKNIRLQSVLDPAAGPVLGDSERLQQIVWNLLSNAIKFTPKQGRVQIGLQRINSHIEIVVADTGQGISAEFLPYVFERFRQADGSITRSFGGLGLGLAIVRQLVELHGGTVHAQSPGEGQGATFTVKLPLLAVGPTAIEPERVHPTVGDSVPFDCSSQLEGLKILIVDDDPDMRDLLAYTLEVCGAEVIAAASADEAISALTQSSPPMDILISDIGMPDEDGYALLRRVRALESNNKGRISAIALTAYARTQDRTAALLAGFQSHIAKPVQPAELIAVIANLTGRISGI